jgi:proliferating cell nuclear antigen PCNA
MVRIIFGSKTEFISPLVAIKDLHDDLRLVVSPNKINANILDTTHVSVTYVEWQCETDGHIPETGLEISLKISSLLKAVSLGSSTSDTLEFAIDQANDSMIVSMDNGDVTISLKLYDFDTDMIQQPELRPGITFDVPGSRFGVIVRDLATIGDTVSMVPKYDAQSGGSSLTLQTEGDVGKATITLTDVSAVQYIVDQFPEGAQSYSLRYLVTILKAASKPQQTVSISFTRDMPLLLHIATGGMSLSFYLAPKFDSDEDDAS